MRKRLIEWLGGYTETFYYKMYEYREGCENLQSLVDRKRLEIESLEALITKLSGERDKWACMIKPEFYIEHYPENGFYVAVREFGSKKTYLYIEDLILCNTLTFTYPLTRFKTEAKAQKVINQYREYHNE